MWTDVINIYMYVCMHACMHVCSGIHCTPFWIWMLCCVLYLVVYLLEISTADRSLIKTLMSQSNIYATLVVSVMTHAGICSYY